MLQMSLANSCSDLFNLGKIGLARRSFKSRHKATRGWKSSLPRAPAAIKASKRYTYVSEQCRNLSVRRLHHEKLESRGWNLKFGGGVTIQAGNYPKRVENILAQTRRLIGWPLLRPNPRSDIDRLRTGQ